MCWDLLWSWVGAYSGHGLGPTLVMGWDLLWSWVGAYSDDDGYDGGEDDGADHGE